jgi:acylphosphatase
MMKRAHVYIWGNVQGVYFRATTQENAQEHDINGWVRNLADGRVEAVFEGDEEAIRAMLEFCNDGPEMAIVETVRIDWEDPEQLDGFEIRR